MSASHIEEANRAQSAERSERSGSSERTDSTQRAISRETYTSGNSDLFRSGDGNANQSLSSRFSQSENYPDSLGMSDVYGGYADSPMTAQSVMHQQCDDMGSGTENTATTSNTATNDSATTNGDNGTSNTGNNDTINIASGGSDSINLTSGEDATISGSGQTVTVTDNGTGDTTINVNNNGTGNATVVIGDGADGSNSGSSSSTSSSDAIVSQLASTDPNLANDLTAAQSTMSASGYQQYEQTVYQNWSSGDFPDDRSLLTASNYQFAQSGASSSDVAAAQAAEQTALGSGDAAVSTFGSGTTGTDTGSGAPSTDTGSGTTGTDTGSGSTGTDTGSTASSTDAVLNDIAAIDPQLAQVLQSAEGSMSSAGYSDFEGLLLNQLEYGQNASDAAALTAAETQFSQAGGSASDLAAVENAANGATLSDGSSTGSSGTASTAGGSTETSGGGSTETSGGGSTETSGGGSTDTGSGGTASTTGSSSLSNAEAATVQVTANDGGGEESLGSGYFLNSGGLIATDDHVTQGASSVEITTASGQNYNAKVVYTDAADDVTFLQVEGQGSTQFSSVAIGNSSDQSGTYYALSHPDGQTSVADDPGTYSGTTSFGSLDVTDNTVADNNNRTMDEYTNMGTQEGSSGGGIFNSSGQLVSMVDIGDGEGDEDATPSSVIASDYSAYENSLA